MAATLNILDEEINLREETTVNNATVVRLFNTDDYDDTLIIKCDEEGYIIASVTLGAGEILNLVKKSTETFESMNKKVIVKAVKIALSA